MNTWKKSLEPYRTAETETHRCKARTVKKMKQRTKQLRRIWERHASLSLGQLIEKAYPEGDFALETDEKFFATLEALR